MAAALAAPFELNGLLGSVSIIRSQQDTHRAPGPVGPIVREAAGRLCDLPAAARPAGAPEAVQQIPLWHEESGPAAPRAEAAGPAVARSSRLLAVLAASPAGAEATGRGLARRIGASTATALKLRDTAVEAGLACVRRPAPGRAAADPMGGADRTHPGPVSSRTRHPSGPLRAHR
jgi:hypothetical protein